MNIFKETNDFIGSVDLEQENSLSSLFRLAKQIRTKLGKQGYLLDHYLSLFFDAVYHLPPQEALDHGAEAIEPYRKICEAVLDPSKNIQGNPLYSKALTAIIRESQINAHSEYFTRLSLLYIVMADDFFSDAVQQFSKKRASALDGIWDAVWFKEIYGQIVQITGEAVMETLNLKLKQKFLATPQMMVFLQGFASDILGCLILRDIESSKQMFQLILDDIPE